MTDYKPGDQVRFIYEQNFNDNWTTGNIYTVSDFSAGHERLGVVADNHGHPNAWMAEYFEPVVDEEYESLRETLTELHEDLQERFNHFMSLAEAVTPDIEALRDELEELEARRTKLRDQANRYDAQLTAIERILTEGE